MLRPSWFVVSRLALFVAAGLVLALGLLVSAPAEAAHVVLLRDDFDGSSLDTSKWFVPTGDGTFFGRTQIRPPSVPLTVADGAIRLQLDTHNPSALVPGDSFFGSEIDTLETFAVESGLSFFARVRFVDGVPGGLVSSLFSFVFLPAIPGHDEIDFELLSNDVVGEQERVLTNVFDDADFSQPGDPVFANLPGLDMTEWHVYEIRWTAGRIEWLVDSALVRVETDTVPNEPQNVRLNFWAPDMFFTAAYDPALQPAAAPENNEIYYYEVDFVEVRRLTVGLPALGPTATGLAVTLLLVAAIGCRSFVRR
jgi:hypothetical protein